MPAHEVATARGLVHVDEQPGDGAAVVMIHGFPDDSRIHDRLLPEPAGRHVVTFDFLGHGRPGREAPVPPAHGQREGELPAAIAAVIGGLR
jgi:haloalkane dehalogenase